jgi:hypothetical protein
MTAAVIGVIGVVAGALLGGLLNYQAERSRRRALACVAGNLIAAELNLAAKRVEGVIQGEGWAPVDFPTQVWKENAGALAMEVTPALIDELASAYALLELWDCEKNEGNDLSAEKIDEITGEPKLFKSLATRVQAASRGSGARFGRPIRVLVGAVALVAVTVAFLAVLFVPRTETTDATIANALQEQLSGATTVDCSKAEGRWHCDVSYSRQPTGNCPSAATSLGGLGQAEVKLVSSQSGCSLPGVATEPSSYDVAEGSDGPVATPSPGQIERSIHRAAIQLDPPEKSFAERAISWLFSPE